MEEIIKEADRDYKEIRNRRLHNFSQLQGYNILEDSGEYFFNIFEGYKVSEDIKDNEDFIVYHPVEHDDGGDTIAHRYYENQYLGGILALTNDIINPFEELNDGEYIKIIDRRWLYDIVKEAKSISRFKSR